MKHHIDYIKAMIANLQDNGQTLIDPTKVFETEVLFDTIESSIPCAVIKAGNWQTGRDGKIYKRLKDGVANGKVTHRYLRRLYVYGFDYNIEIWLSNPTSELLSSPQLYGVSEQAIEYVFNNQIIEYDERPCKIEIDSIVPVTDPDAQKPEYKLVISLYIEDGLYSIEERQTLEDAVIEIDTPQLQGAN